MVLRIITRTGIGYADEFAIELTYSAAGSMCEVETIHGWVVDCFHERIIQITVHKMEILELLSQL